MTLRLGFVGCGKWSRKLAESFRACGAEIVAFDRASRVTPARFHPEWRAGTPGTPPHGPPGLLPGEGVPPADGFGTFMPWRDQLADKSIDAIVAVAPPEITTEVAMACAAAGKAVMATKPLFDHPERITAPFYVDFWRLYSRGWKLFNGPPHPGHGSTSFELHGSGPFREFPGGLDYGPHVMAWILSRYGLGPDVGGAQRGALLQYAHRVTSAQGELFSIGGAGWDARFGNGSPGAGAAIDHSGRSARSRGWSGKSELPDCYTSWIESPTEIVFEGPVGYAENGNDYGPQVRLVETKADVMQNFCQSFLSDVSEGFVDTKLLSYSREGMRMLREIRERAT